MKTWPWRPNSEGGRKTLLHLASEAGWAEGVSAALGEGRQGIFRNPGHVKKISKRIYLSYPGYR